MKKLILISILTITSLIVNAQIYTIINASFDTSNAVLSGSEQFIDIKYVGIDGTDFNVGFFLIQSTLFNDYSQVIINDSFEYFQSLPQVTDSTKRFTFSIPNVNKNGRFLIVVNKLSGESYVGGKVTFATSTITMEPEKTKPLYYLDIFGNKTNNLSGFLIAVYSNDRRKKIYLIE